MIGNPRRRVLRYVAFAAVWIAAVASAGWGGTYYVSPSGNDNGAGTAAEPWRTVQKAADAMSAGDTAIVLPGTYGEAVATRRGGTPGAYITFTGGGDAALRRFQIAHDWIRVDGFRFTGYTSSNDGSVFIGGSGAQVLNCTITDTADAVYGILTKHTEPYPDNVLIRGNVLDRVRYHNMVLFLTNSTVDANEIRNTSMDAFRVWGHDILIRNNYVHDMVDDPSNHPDFIQTFGHDDEHSYNVVIEGNRMENCFAQPCNLSNDGSVRQHDWIFRNNVFYRVAGACNVGIPNVSFHNNTFYDSNYYNDSFAIGFLSGGGFNGNNGVVRNNLFIDSNRTNTGWYTKDDGLALSADYNYVAGLSPTFGAKTGFSETHGVNGGDPKFRDLAARDFRLLFGSKAINAGVAAPGFAYDRDGAPRPAGAGWDMGAYEYQGPFGRKPMPPTDVRVTN
jgi:hypothetical protein